jgi:hypothetical protein
MNPQKATIVILATLFVSLALAEDFKTVSGKIYEDATISHVEADGIVLRTKTGISKVYFVELPKDVQERFHYGSATPIGKAVTQRVDNAESAQHATPDFAQQLETSCRSHLTNRHPRFVISAIMPRLIRLAVCQPNRVVIPESCVCNQSANANCSPSSDTTCLPMNSHDQDPCQVLKGSFERGDGRQLYF